MKYFFGKFAFFVLIAFASVWVAWMATDNILPYEYLRGHIVPSPAKQGEQVTLPWDIKVNRLCPGNVHRVLFNAEPPYNMVGSYDRTPSSISVKIGDTVLVKTFQLPRGLPPRIRYTANVCFECNVLQHFIPLCVQTPDLYFSVE